MRRFRTLLLRLFWLGLVVAVGLLTAAMVLWPGDSGRPLSERLASLPLRAFNQMRPDLNFGNNGACLRRLPARAVAATPIAAQHTERGCRLDHAVHVTGVGPVTLSRPAVLTCRMADLLATFLSDVVRPAAQAELGSPVVRLVHFGTYNCRTMRGSSGLLSEHAYANAIDIAAFRLADGRQVSVQRDWQDPPRSATARFLRRTAEGACRLFSATLTPNSNALHHDHFHLDAGLFRHCGL